MEPGNIIFLNGTSSDGKTTIASSLQDTLETAYMRASLDDFFHHYPEKLLSPRFEEEAQVLMRLVPKVVSGFHHTVSGVRQPATLRWMVDPVLLPIRFPPIFIVLS